MGESRRAESLAALETLGLPAEDIRFLGYPDRGIQLMLEAELASWPIPIPPVHPREQFALHRHLPTGAAYCGENLFSDLQALVNDYRPDLVVLPHPADQHSDHAAASTFTASPSLPPGQPIPPTGRCCGLTWSIMANIRGWRVSTVRWFFLLPIWSLGRIPGCPGTDRPPGAG